MIADLGSRPGSAHSALMNTIADPFATDGPDPILQLLKRSLVPVLLNLQDDTFFPKRIWRRLDC